MLYRIADPCVKCKTSKYRKVYDEARAKYADAKHGYECIRCGTKKKKGKPGVPAKPGTDLKASHKHARAMRAVMKAILRDLWGVAGGQELSVNQRDFAAG